MSMTGFGAAEESGKGFSLALEVRSVNSRYLRIQTRIPEELGHWGGPAEEMIRGSIRRGTVTLTARLYLVPGEAAELLDEKALQKWLALCIKLARRFKVQPPQSITEVLALPGVLPLQGERIAPRPAVLEPVFRKALNKALKGFREMRRREGEALASEMRLRLKKVSKLLRAVEKAAPEGVRAAQKRLYARIAELLERREDELTHEELAREVALLAERCDITEELDRFKSHVAQAQSALAEGGPVGRRLEFLAQEMLRESTTMAAKAASPELTELVLELKLEADRLKEQAQNIE